MAALRRRSSLEFGLLHWPAIQPMFYSPVTRVPQGETEQIGKLLEGTMLRKVGPAALKDHFMLMDTICDATQERQDAVTELVSRQEQARVRRPPGGGRLASCLSCICPPS